MSMYDKVETKQIVVCFDESFKGCNQATTLDVTK